MSQMSQKIINTNNIRNYLIEYPEAENKELYLFFEAINDKQKGSIRKIKNRINKKKNVSNHPGPKSSGKKKLTEEFIEQLIVDGLENNPGNVQLIGKATDFFIKVKGKASEMEEELDVKELINLGIVKRFND